jgi:hypothetical protein
MENRGSFLKENLLFTIMFTCIQIVNNLCTKTFTSIQKCIHIVISTCIQFCNQCVQLCIQIKFGLQPVYMFTNIFLFTSFPCSIYYFPLPLK